VKLLTVEVSFNGHPFEVTSADDAWNLQLKSSVELWHKEAAINRGFEKLLELVPDAENIAWIDADVKFSDPNWATNTVKKLKHHKVIQLFSEAQSLDPHHQSQWKTPGLFFNYFHKVGYHQIPSKPLKYTTGGHPGLAWAARREALNLLGGLLDFCVHGSADTHMANALMGNVKHGHAPRSFAWFYESPWKDGQRAAMTI